MTHKKTTLNPAQKSAVEYLDGPLLVLAGPGTGKTQLLSEKVKYILENTDTAPENILCLTFTEAGADNMRNRLHDIVGPAAHNVAIYTYHAFGSTILGKYKNYATNFTRILDAPIDNVTQYKIIKKIQDTLPLSDPLKSANISDILETISAAKSARLSAEDLEKIAQDNSYATKKINPILNDHLKKLVPRMPFEKAKKEVYLPILKTLTDSSKNTPIIKDIYKETNALSLELHQIITAEQEKEKPSISPLTSWKNANFEQDSHGNYRLKNIIANKKLASLAHIFQTYNQALEKDGLFDFADMVEQAIHFLKTDRGFKLTVSEHYEYILLDEFQDTNTSQAELIYLLTDYEKPNIMAVGDDDQAIFAFQGANASNLINFQNHYNAHLVTLIDNYRSTAEILDLSRQVADQITDSFAKIRHIDKHLNAVNSTALHKSKNSQISRHEFPAADAEYFWVAEKINKLITSGVPQSEIAIITPKHKYIASLLPYLKSYQNINISYEKRENILEDEKLKELFKLTRFIYEIREKLPLTHTLLEILSLPFLEIPPATALKTFYLKTENDSSPIDPLLDSDSPQIKSLGTFLASLIQESYEAPLELFLDYLIGTTPLNNYTSPFLKYYNKNPENQTTFTTYSLYENLICLTTALNNYQKTETGSIKTFLDFLDDYTLAGQAILNTSPYQEAENAVQILTAHKAKGLEYKYVFLIAADNLSWGKAKGNNNLLTLPKNLVQIRHTGITDDERLRLLFVALTRAKSHLVISSSMTDFSGKTPARLTYLTNYENRIINHSVDESKKITLIEKHWLTSYQNLTPDILPMLKDRVKNYRLSASDLISFIDIAYAGPMTLYLDKILRAPSATFSESLCLGNLLHSTFEKITNEKLDKKQALAAFLEFFTATPIPKPSKSIIKEQGIESLEASFDTFSDILLDPDSKAEVDFYQDRLAVEDVPITGKIDHLKIDKKNKTIEIYDFKTGNYHPDKWSNHATLYKYMLQLEFYKLLVTSSPEYKNYRVEKAHILFVKPDVKDHLVYNKIYEYNEIKKTEFLSLIKAVYHQIKTLDFLSNPELALLPDNTRTIKDIKSFIDLLIS